MQTDVSTNDTKLFAVRLSEADKRRIKSLAASQGLTLREAIVQAFDAWGAQLESQAHTPGPTHGATAGRSR